MKMSSVTQQFDDSCMTLLFDRSSVPVVAARPSVC